MAQGDDGEVKENRKKSKRLSLPVIVFLVCLVFVGLERYFQQGVSDRLVDSNHLSHTLRKERIPPLVSMFGLNPIIIPDVPKPESKQEFVDLFEDTIVRLQKRDECKSSLSLGLTIVTQGDPSRFGRVLQSCSKWAGDMVAVLYVRSALELENFLHKYSDEIGQPNNPEMAARHILELCPRLRVLPAMPDTPPKDNSNYPVNILRNLAIDAVQTSHFLYLDMDLVPSSNLFDVLTHLMSQRPGNAFDEKAVYVVPSFWVANSCEYSEYCQQTYGKGPDTIEDITMCMAEGYCEPFLWSLNPLSHSSTVYSKVLSIPQSSTDPVAYPLPCLHSHRYEAFVIAPTCSVPHFVSGFDGYGKNKIQWIEHLSFLGFSFLVLSHVFAVHLPHESSESMRQFSPEKQQRVGRMHDEFIHWLSDTYQTTQEAGLCATDEKTATEIAIADMSVALGEANAYMAANARISHPSLYEDSIQFQVVFPSHVCKEETGNNKNKHASTLENCKTECVSNDRCNYLVFDHMTMMCVLLDVCTPHPQRVVTSRILQKRN